MPRARRLALPLAVLLAAAAAAATAVIALPSAAAAPESLRLVQRSPLVLSGRDFVARERVRVRVTTAGDRAVRRVRASRSGAFRLTFSGLDFDRCNGLSAVATGSQGSRATLKRVPLECPPSLRPGEQQGSGGSGAGAPPSGGSCGPPAGEQTIQASGKRPPPACPPN
jgi:hypothetical protein